MVFIGSQSKFWSILWSGCHPCHIQLVFIYMSASVLARTRSIGIKWALFSCTGWTYGQYITEWKRLMVDIYRPNTRKHIKLFVWLYWLINQNIFSIYFCMIVLVDQSECTVVFENNKRQSKAKLMELRTLSVCWRSIEFLMWCVCCSENWCPVVLLLLKRFLNVFPNGSFHWKKSILSHKWFSVTDFQ